MENIRFQKYFKHVESSVNDSCFGEKKSKQTVLEYTCYEDISW